MLKKSGRPRKMDVRDEHQWLPGCISPEHNRNMVGGCITWGGVDTLTVVSNINAVKYNIDILE